MITVVEEAFRDISGHLRAFVVHSGSFGDTGSEGAFRSFQGC